MENSERRTPPPPWRRGGCGKFSPTTPSNAEAPRRTQTASSYSAARTSPRRMSSPFASSSPRLAQKSPARAERATTKQEAKSDAAIVRERSICLIRQKKVSPQPLEEEYHRYRVAYNRLLHWRFASACAEASIAAVRRTAEKKLLKVCIKICAIRNSTVEKRTLLQKLKHDLKLNERLKSEMKLLDAWSRIERQNVLGVARVVRKLSAISVCLLLDDDAKADPASVHAAMSEAMEEVESIQEMIADVHSEVEKACSLLMQLCFMMREQRRFFQERERWASVAA